MKRFIFISIALLMIGCNNYLSSYDFTCAQQLTEEEINRLTLNTATEYTQQDMDLLLEISNVFNVEKPGENIGVSYNSRNEELLVLDIYGFKSEENIDRAICMLQEQENLDFPKRTILLFHETTDEDEDAGVIVGLKL